MDYEVREDQVLRAAARVFAARGFHRASIRDIAREADLSLAGLYYYVPSKADLLFRIASNVFDVLIVKLEEALATVGDAQARVRVFIGNHLDFFLTHMDEMKVVAREDAFLEDALHNIVAEKKRRYYHKAVELLRRVDANRSEEGLRIAALALFGMMNWLYTWYRPAKDADPKRLANELTTLYLCGFLHDANDAPGVRHARHSSGGAVPPIAAGRLLSFESNLTKELVKMH